MAAGTRHISALLVAAQHKLGLNQAELGKLLGGVTRRTVWRYQGGRSSPHPTHVLALAGHVFPKDASLAAELAAARGETLESLGLVAPQAAKVEPPAPPPIDAKQARLLVDAVVCAAAEELDVSPRNMRRALHAAFARANETGLTMDVIESVLAPKPAKATKGERSRA
jgi:transcriptional regulator with XRE-family HTH domain